MHIKDDELEIIRSACALEFPKPIGGLTARTIIARLDAAEKYIHVLNGPQHDEAESVDAEDAWYASKGEDTP